MIQSVKLQIINNWIFCSQTSEANLQIIPKSEYRGFHTDPKERSTRLFLSTHGRMKPVVLECHIFGYQVGCSLR
ncbi:hypothetical protein [Leptospira yanagawae]|uniref:hypothetical protein n=1 Tax=Leptospira yanagawae TaxID=293069 RepID=UPI0012EB67B0|nr:hypothetical protein [Leptospira yanagawae]